jgi:hypothetical protein
MPDSLQLSHILNSMFLKHPEEQGMTYFEHLKHACSYALQAVGCSFIFIIHGFIPCLFEKTGSTMIEQLNNQLNQNKTKKE